MNLNKKLNEANEQEEILQVTYEQEELIEKDIQTIRRQLERQYDSDNVNVSKQSRRMNYYCKYGIDYYFNLEKLYDIYHNRKKVEWREATYKNNKYIINPFLDFMKHNVEIPSIRQDNYILINQDTLNIYIAYLQSSGKSPYTINSQLKTIRSFILWMIEFTNVDLKVKIKASSTLKYTHDIYTEDELKNV